MNINLDNVVENFLQNLQIEKPIYEMEADKAREFLLNIQERDYKDLIAHIDQ